MRAWSFHPPVPAWPRGARPARLPPCDRRRAPALRLLQTGSGAVLYEEGEDVMEPWGCAESWEDLWEDPIGDFDDRTFEEWQGYVGLFGGWIC